MLYLSKYSAPQIVEQVFGVRAEGVTDETLCYLAPTADDHFMQGLYTEQHPLGMVSEKAVKMPVAGKAKLYARLTLPYTVPHPFRSLFPTDIPKDMYLSQDDPRVPFATIHANPPGKLTNYAGIMEASYGKGRVIWSAIPFEKAARFQHGEIFARIVGDLAGGFQFSAEAHESVECVLFDAPEEQLKLIGLIETREDYNIEPVHDVVVRVACADKPKGVYLLPNRDPLPFTDADGTVEIKIDAFDIFCMIAIEY